MFVLAAVSSHLGLFAPAFALGFAIGVFGHIIQSRTLILTGILVIALVSTFMVVYAFSSGALAVITV